MADSNSLSRKKFHKVSKEILRLVHDIKEFSETLYKTTNIPTDDIRFLSSTTFVQRNIGYTESQLAYYKGHIEHAQNTLPVAEIISDNLDLLNKNIVRLQWYLQDRDDRIRARYAAFQAKDREIKYIPSCNRSIMRTL